MNQYTLNWYMLGSCGTMTIWADSEKEAAVEMWKQIEAKQPLMAIRSYELIECFYHYD